MRAPQLGFDVLRVGVLRRRAAPGRRDARDPVPLGGRGLAPDVARRRRRHLQQLPPGRHRGDEGQRGHRAARPGRDGGPRRGARRGGAAQRRRVLRPRPLRLVVPFRPCGRGRRAPPAVGPVPRRSPGRRRHGEHAAPRHARRPRTFRRPVPRPGAAAAPRDPGVPRRSRDARSSNRPSPSARSHWVSSSAAAPSADVEKATTATTTTTAARRTRSTRSDAGLGRVWGGPEVGTEASPSKEGVCACPMAGQGLLARRGRALVTWRRAKMRRGGGSVVGGGAATRGAPEPELPQARRVDGRRSSAAAAGGGRAYPTGCSLK